MKLMLIKIMFQEKRQYYAYLQRHELYILFIAEG